MDVNNDDLKEIICQLNAANIIDTSFRVGGFVLDVVKVGAYIYETLQNNKGSFSHFKRGTGKRMMWKIYLQFYETLAMNKSLLLDTYIWLNFVPW